MAYPSSLDNLQDDYQGTDQADVVDHAGMHNAERTAINAVQAELGTEPKGSAASVKARLDGIEAGTRLGAGSVATAALADGAVTADKLATDSVTAAKIAANAVGADEIAAGAVGTGELADDAVTADKIADLTIVDALISASAAIAWSKIAGAYTARTSNYTITAADSVIAADTTSGAVVLTLPAASGMTGKALRIVKTAGANTLTISRAGSDTISPSSGSRTSVAFPSGTHGEMVLVSSGTGWHVVSGQASDETVGRRLWKFEQALAASSTTATVGWQLIHADTGWRDIASLATMPGTATLVTLALRRAEARVHLAARWRDTQTNPSRVQFVTLPAGFRPAYASYQQVPYDSAVTTHYRNLFINTNGVIEYGGPTQAGDFFALWTGTTNDAWPASLPGSASGSIPTGA